MDRSHVNLWGTGDGGTVSVYEHPESASIGGVQQLVGNVWEWTSSTFGAWEPATRRIETHLPLKSIRGGAFDTYFENPATCHYQSGEQALSRRPNIGFRLALPMRDLEAPAKPTCDNFEHREPPRSAEQEELVAATL